MEGHKEETSKTRCMVIKMRQEEREGEVKSTETGFPTISPSCTSKSKKVKQLL